MIQIPNGHILVPESVSSCDSLINASSIRPIKGLAKAVLPEEISQREYYRGIKKQTAKIDPHSYSREFDRAVVERLTWAVENGKINQPDPDTKKPRDERKLRYDTHEWENGELIIGLGPSHFQEHIHTNLASRLDAAYHARLAIKGVQDWNDPTAYFANNLALNAVIISSDGRYFLGQRSMEAHLWPGWWHNVGVFPIATEMLPLFDRADGGESIRSALHEAMRRGIYGEAGIEPGEIESQREISITSGITSVDISYEVRLTIDSTALLGKDHLKGKIGHEGFVSVEPFDLVDVLSDKKIFTLENLSGVERPRGYHISNVVPSGLGGLLVSLDCVDRDAIKQILSSPRYQFTV